VSSIATAGPEAIRRIQRRSVLMLSAGQVFNSVGTAAVVTVGPLLGAQLAGDAWSGGPATAMSLGAAVAAALLARLAVARGRRIGLSTGIFIALVGAVAIIGGAAWGSFWLVLVGSVLSGFGNAASQQARFAATDLALPRHRGRDLATVVWLGTVGVVVGPNLIGAGDATSAWLGLPALAGLFVISAGCLLVSLALIALGLRPDPLLTARALQDAGSAAARRPGFVAGLRTIWAHRRARAGLAGVVIGHGLMAGYMAMTPVHMASMDTVVEVIGLVVSIHMLAMYGLSPLWGVLADRIGGATVVGIGLVVLIASGIVGAIAGMSELLVATSLTLLGLGWGLATVAGAVLIVDAVGESDRVAAQGASDTLMNASSAVLGLLAGFGLAGIGYDGLGVAVAVIAALALGFVAVNARRR